MQFELIKVFTSRDGVYMNRESVTEIKTGQDMTDYIEIPIELLPPDTNLNGMRVVQSNDRFNKGKFVLDKAKIEALQDGNFQIAQEYKDPDFGQCHRYLKFEAYQFPELRRSGLTVKKELKDSSNPFGTVIEHLLFIKDKSPQVSEPDLRIVPVTS